MHHVRGTKSSKTSHSHQPQPPSKKISLSLFGCDSLGGGGDTKGCGAVTPSYVPTVADVLRRLLLQDRKEEDSTAAGTYAKSVIGRLASYSLAGEKLDEGHAQAGDEAAKFDELALVCLQPPDGAEVDDNSDVPAFGLQPQAFDFALIPTGANTIVQISGGSVVLLEELSER